MKDFLILALLLAAAPAVAQNSGQPVEISAAKTLEWDRNAKTYTARENARAKQGNFEVTSDVLTARYTDADGSTDINEMIATGSVKLLSPPYRAYGEKAVYDVKTGNAVMTGNNLKIETDTEYLTARDKIEFFGSENRLTATGDAQAQRGTDTLKADVVNGFFAEDAQGKLALEKMTAEGHVIINTAKETVHGDHGVYNVAQQQAVLTGQVRIFQGENWLEGTRAEVDLKTGIAKLFAPDNAATEGRVKGVFYPKSRKNN